MPVRAGFSRLVSLLYVAGSFLPAFSASADEHARALPTRPAPIIIDLLLDNSPSMEIGATPGDIAAMMYLTPCSEPGAVYSFHSASMQAYSAYQCAGRSIYDGQSPPFGEPACPIEAPRGVAGMATLMPSFRGPRCTNLANGIGAPTAGAPCAFACHWDSRSPLGASRDYYGLARSTIGQTPCYQAGGSPGACAITLRADLVKNAVVRLIDTMEEDDFAGLARLSLGVFTFDVDLHRIYPRPEGCDATGRGRCAAGRDWALALGSVGTAPDLPDTVDAGIQPFAGENIGSTDLPRAMTTLAGDAMNAAIAAPAARRVLFLVTDGLDDHMEGDGRVLKAIDPNVCQMFKDKGIEVFVVYTPYYPLMNGFYLTNISQVAEGDGAGSLSAALRRCASDPIQHFIEAAPADPASISTALQTFLARLIKGS